MMAVTLAALATAALGGDLRSTLSPDRPEDRAILGYLELAEAKKASAADLTELGVLLAARGRLDDAEHWLRKAVRVDRHAFDAWYRLGLVQQQRGHSHDAARSFARALQERPDDPYARFMLALSLERAGRSHSAITEYARAYAALPELADPRKNPVVLDSSLQTAANLRHYRETVTATTMPLRAVDPAAVAAMAATRAAAGKEQPPAALPAAETIPVPTPTPPPPTPPPGAPGGADPRLRPPG